MAACKHFWIIAAGGSGPTSWGECQKCPAVKEFANYVEDNNPNNKTEKGAPKTYKRTPEPEI